MLALYSAGVVSGYGDSTFCPNTSVNRVQVAKILVSAFEVPLAEVSTARQFSDVAANHPFYGYIEAAASRGWISGYGDGTYRTYANVTQGQVAKMVILATGLKLVSPQTATFTDVPSGSTYYSYIETAYAHGVLSGYPDLTFLPGAEATRRQIAKIVLNATYPRRNNVTRSHFHNIPGCGKPAGMPVDGIPAGMYTVFT